MSEPNQSWRSLVRPETVLDAAEKLSRPEFIEWMGGILTMVEREARLAERLAIGEDNADDTELGEGGSDAV